VKTRDGGSTLDFGLADCAVTLDFVFEDFVRRFALHTRQSLTKTPFRLANGQRVTSSTVCDVTFELARHEFQRTFYVLRDLRAADLIMRVYHGLTTNMTLYSLVIPGFLLLWMAQ
jgi:hypothetical protein